MAFCTSCGARLSPPQPACNACGASVIYPVVSIPSGPGLLAAAPPPGAAGASPPRGNGRTGALVLVVAVVAYLIHLGMSDPRRVVGRCLDGIEEWNARKVLESFRPADRAALASITSAFAQMREKGVRLRINDRRIEVLDQTEKRCVLSVHYQLTSADAKSSGAAQPMVDEITLVREKGQWFIADSATLVVMLQALQLQHYAQMLMQ